MKYIRKVGVIVLLAIATLTTWIISSTKATYLVCSGESDTEDEKNESVEVDPTSDEVKKLVEGTIPTLQAEISELDTVGFDEALLIGESIDMYSKKDA